MKAQRGVEIKFYSFFSLGGRGGWGADVTTMVSQRRNRYVAWSCNNSRLRRF